MRKRRTGRTKVSSQVARPAFHAVGPEGDRFRSLRHHDPAGGIRQHLRIGPGCDTTSRIPFGAISEEAVGPAAERMVEIMHHIATDFAQSPPGLTARRCMHAFA